MKTYTDAELKEILDSHSKWLRNDGGKRADLCGANLRDASLYNANLYGASLQDANLCGANLRGASLYNANLRDASLRGASLQDANLHHTNLKGANLYYADLIGANLRKIKNFHPYQLFSCYWGKLSDDLTAHCMAFDASNHPYPKMFDDWANGGRCPYSVKVERVINFEENRSLWDPNLKHMSPWDIMVEILKEKCANSDWHYKR